ncbi:hypothetical protein T492DRAFT_1133957 [Pavlovales sp. CCMP2436]|nr:hypothetical protein T492DRAFT_1133957 [Pavlovales sp. CCMP2436]
MRFASVITLSLLTVVPVKPPTTGSQARCAVAWRELNNGCGVTVFRHLDKTAGTTVRFAIEQGKGKTACTSWEGPVSYRGFSTLAHELPELPTPVEAHLGKEWLRRANASALERKLKSSSRLLTLPCVTEHGAASSVFPKMHLESHAETNPYARYLQDLPRLAARWPTCSFRVYTIIREPIKRVVSIYSYFLNGRGNAHNFSEFVAPCVRLANSSAPGTACRLQVTEAFPHLAGPVNAGENERVRGWLTREMERGSLFVGTIELFDVSMALLGMRWGLPLAKATLLSKPKNVVFKGVPRHAASIQTNAELRANPAMYKQLQKAFALDYWLHAFASDRLRAEAARQLPLVPVGQGGAAGKQRCLRPGALLPGTGTGTGSSLVEELVKQRKMHGLKKEPAAMAFLRLQSQAACTAASRVRCAEIGVADETRRGASLNLAFDV